MQAKLPQYDIGVLVGRFQVHELHDAHRELIQFVCDQHDKVVILLGVAPIPGSTSNPLDFEARKQMILAEFPDVNVLYIKDTGDDATWSKKLDEIVNDTGLPGQSVILYGGRDSFIAHYTGQFPTRELTQSVFLSGTATRRQIAKSSTRKTPDFRAGVIWATQTRFPTAYQTVDIAILNAEGNAVLLAQRKDEPLMRFPGGFSDPNSDSLEADAIREVKEETNLDVSDLVYLGSTRVDDWRYRQEPDCIKTALFAATWTFGRPEPLDDLEGGELRWVDPMQPNLAQRVMPAHIPLLGMLKIHLNRKGMR